MKNIHVLPTPNPSKIYSYKNELGVIYSPNIKITLESTWREIRKNFSNSYTPQNIYITSDEEIKEESLTKEIYVIDIQNGNIGKLNCKNRFFKGSSKLIEIEWKNKQNIRN